jgi:hypothetical protein
MMSSDRTRPSIASERLMLPSLLGQKGLLNLVLPGAPVKKFERRIERERMTLTRNKEPRPDIRARKPRLPGARFLEECGGKQGAARGDLFGSVGSCMLKPPGDDLNKHRGHEVWYKLV